METDYASVALVKFVFGIFCAYWAQTTIRSAWLWFFLGWLFAPITRASSSSIRTPERRPWRIPPKRHSPALRFPTPRKPRAGRGNVEPGEMAEVVPWTSSRAFFRDLVEVVNAESAWRDSDTRPHRCELRGSAVVGLPPQQKRAIPQRDSPSSR